MKDTDEGRKAIQAYQREALSDKGALRNKQTKLRGYILEERPGRSVSDGNGREFDIFLHWGDY